MPIRRRQKQFSTGFDWLPGSALILAFFLCAGSAWGASRTLPEIDPIDLHRAGLRHADESVLLTGRKLTADLRFSPFSNGFNGTMIIEKEIWIRSLNALQDYFRIGVATNPRQKLDDVVVTILSEGRSKPVKLKNGDLKWVRHGSEERGVVHLDEERRTTSVPGLRVGDLMYYRIEYRVKGLHGVMPAELGGGDLPVLVDSYELRLPADHRLQIALTGQEESGAAIQETVAADDATQIRVWQLVDGPEGDSCEDLETSIRITPHVTGLEGRDPLPEFCLGESWTEAGANYRRRIADTMESTLEIDALAAELTATCRTDSQRVEAVYRYIQETTRYLGMYEGAGGIIPVPAPDVLRNHYGDCKGLGVLLIALLRSAGVDAHPALVRTDHLGPLADAVPNMTQFNHFIVWADVGPQGMWLDATVDYCPPGLVPPADASSQVLLLRPDFEGLQEIPTSSCEAGEVRVTVAGVLGSDWFLECDIERETTGFASVRQCNRTERSNRGEVKEAIRRCLLPRTLGMTVARCEASDTSDEKRTLWTLAARSSTPLPSSSGTAYLPMSLPPGPHWDVPNEADGQPTYRESWRIRLPFRWTVVPDSVELRSHGVRWHRRIAQEGDLLQLERAISFPSLPDGTADSDSLDEILKNIGRMEAGFIRILAPGPE